ncbi:MAG: hypothetical protein V9H69_01025 [Anaerolineae bacterium]
MAVASPDVSGTTLAEVRTDDELAAASSLSACNRKGSSMDAPNHLALLLAAPQPGRDGHAPRPGRDGRSAAGARPHIRPDPHPA